MRVVTLTDALEGQVLAMPIHGDGGRLMLAQGTRLSRSLIEALRRRGYTRVALDDQLTRDIVPDEGIHQETRDQAIQALSSTAAQVISGNPNNFTALKKAVEAIISDLRESKDGALGIYSLCSFDQETFTHSINVCILSLTIADGMSLSLGDMKALGLGALLHDIGKLLIPKPILNKPSLLTTEEYSLMQTHVEKGWELLSQCYSVGAISGHAALDHHERLDGSGYPRQLKGDQISLFGKITAVADVHEAMNADRPQRKAIFPEAVYDYLKSNRGVLFDPDAVDILYSRIALYPNGSILAIWGGFVGVVVKQDPRSTRRPIVRIITGPGITKPVDIPLFDRPDLTINMVLDDYPNEARRIVAGDAIEAEETP